MSLVAASRLTPCDGWWFLRSMKFFFFFLRALPREHCVDRINNKTQFNTAITVRNNEGAVKGGGVLACKFEPL